MGQASRRMPRWRGGFGIVVASIISLGAGCAYYPYYDVPPGYYGTVPYGTSPAATFDRAWYAAHGALADEGVAVTSQDRNAGLITGTRNGISVTANLQVQADGNVRVAFRTASSPDQDPTLVDRISRAFDRRMGR